ncbi:MAG TPA: hypothetical protein VGE98_00045 [Thermoanaerobaculia bacterium]
MRTRALLFLVLATATGPLFAEATCPDGKVFVLPAIRQAIKEGVAAFDRKFAPSDTQVDAPASASDGLTLVDHASFPAVIGAALNDGLASTGDRSATINLNLFAFATLLHPSYLSSQEEYEKHTLARKFGGSITFGGTGASFDRNGDGKPDDALKASDLGDIIDYELRFRISKSTDRREGYNADLLRSAINPDDEKTSQLFHDFQRAHLSEITGMSDDIGCAKTSDVKDLLDHTRKEIDAIGTSIGEANQKLKDAAEAITKRHVWSIVAGGSQRRQQFGPNTFRIGLRGELGKTSKHANTFNLDWTRTQAVLSLPEFETVKGAYQHTYLWQKGSRLAPDGIDVAVSASFEHNQKAQGVTHPDIFKANAKLEYPLTDAVKIPLSISWANHADLLKSEHEVRGHFGLTVDFSKLTKPAGVGQEKP